MAKKSTKSALFTSAISLLLCFSMLLGTTFAWFTDSVTSANNIIKSGNLDVEFEYWNGEEWKTVQDASDILTNELWEPGVTEVAYLRVANKGSLALKYQLGVNIVSEKEGTNVAGETFKLSDYIMFGVVEKATQDTYENRADAVAAITDAKKISAGYTKESEIVADGDDHYFALVVYMPETVGNEANHNGTDIPQIDLGINVYATQLNSEDDSFGSDYDITAPLPDVTVYSADELQEAIKNADEDIVISLANDIAGEFEIIQTKDIEVVIDGNGNEFAGEILVDGKSASLDSAGVVIQNVNFKADTNGDFALINLGDGNTSTRYTSNVTIKNCTFDAPVSDDPKVVAIKSYTGGDENLTIVGCTVTSNMHSLVQVANVENLVVENCKIYSKNGINVNQSPNVTISGCTADVKGYAVRFGASSGGNTDKAESYLIENCNLKSACAESDDAVIILRGTAKNATLTINNTTLEGTTEILNNINATIIQ